MKLLIGGELVEGDGEPLAVEEPAETMSREGGKPRIENDAGPAASRAWDEVFEEPRT